MEKEDLLLAYGEYGFGRLGYFHYQVFISQNHQCQFVMSMQTESKNESVSTDIASLSNEEMDSIKKISQEIEKYKIIDEDVNRYDGYSFTVFRNGKEVNTLKDCSPFFRKMETIRSVLQENHEELSRERIKELYENLCEKMKKSYQKVKA